MSKISKSEKMVKSIKRYTRKKYSAEEKIVLFWKAFAVNIL